MDKKPCLLFCDTFMHDNQEDIQLDLIGFSQAVAITEIRVIPHGCKVHPEIRDRLGETKPSSFKLELFIKNLTNPNATTFQKLGVLDYEEGKSIQLISNSKVATNVVLVRGWYHNLTISLYGHFAVGFPQEQQSQVPPPPPVDMNRPIIMEGQVASQITAGMTPQQVQTHVQNMPPQVYVNQSMEGQGGGGGGQMPQPHSAIPPHMDQGGYQSPNQYGRDSPQDDRGERYGGRGEHFGPRGENFEGRRENYGGRGDRFGGGRGDNYGGARVDNYGGGRGDYGGGRGDNFDGRRENFDGRRDNFDGRGDNYGGRGDAFGGGRGDNFGGRAEGFGGRADNFGGRNDNYNEHRGRRDGPDDRGDRRRRDRFDDDRSRGRRDYYDRRNDYRMDQDRGDRRRNDSGDMRGSNSENNNRHNNNMEGDELFEPLSESSDFDDNQGEDKSAKQAPPPPTVSAPTPTVSATGSLTTSAPTSVSKANEKEEIGYEDIESDEDLMLEDCDFDEHLNLQNDFDLLDESWASTSLSFNPYQCSLSPLENISLSSQDEFQKLVQEFRETKVLKEPSQLKQLQDHIVSDSEAQPRDTKWVIMLEELPNIIPTALAYLKSQPSCKIKEKHFVSIITEWAVFSLNMDNVRSLPLAVNIRLLKAGIRLTTMLANFSEDYQRMLVDSKVQEMLLKLLKTEHMASSLKMLILKALDTTTNTALGMENFLGWNCENQGISEVAASIYEELVLYLLRKSTVRIATSIKALLQKAHFYESISNLQSISARITKSSTKEITEDYSKEGEEETRQTKTCISLDINHKDMSDILSAIDNIHKVFLNGNSLIAQPSTHTFPTTAVLQANMNVEDCYPTVIRLLHSRRFLESILVLVSSPLFCELPLYLAIQELLFTLMSSQKGLIFLSMYPTTCNGLIRTLLSSSGSGNENDEDYSDMPTLREYMMSTDISEQCTPHHLGLLLTFHLQTLQRVDQMFSTAKPGMSLLDLDTNDHIFMLHTMFAMTLTHSGRDALACTLALGENLNCLFPFLAGDEEEIEQKIKKSVCNRYSAVLLNLVLLQSDNVEYVEKFGSKLLAIHKKENDRVHEDIHNFLAPIEKISKLDINAVQPLFDVLKDSLADLRLGSPAVRSTVMVLRLLKRLVKKNEQSSASQKDLHQKLVAIKMISANALDIFIQTFHKICEQLTAPWKQNEPFSNPQCTIFVNMAALLLELTDILLTQILTTTYIFKDARLVQELFSLYKILCTKPPFGYLTSILTRIQENVIALLIKFMQGTTEAPESEEAVKTSTWYILFKELLIFSSAKPENFTTGLILLSELLHTPLPVHSLRDLSEEEMSKVMNHRLFSMANFSCLGPEIKVLLKNTIGSCCSALQYYLRRVLCQLIDLGPSVSLLIIRCLCEMIDEAVNKALKESDENTNEGEPKDEKKRVLPSLTYNTLSLLSYLVCQPGGKASFLNLVTTTAECVSEYASFLPNLIAVQRKESDWFYLENCLLPLAQSICDHELCLSNFNGIITQQHLSNNLPVKEHLDEIVEMLIQVMTSDTLPLQLLVRCLNTLESLTDHDYGMRILRKLITDKESTLITLMDRLYKEANESNESTVVYTCISAFLEFLNLLNSSAMDNYMKPDMESSEDEKPVVKMEDVKEDDEEENQANVQIEQAHKETSSKRMEQMRRTIFVSPYTLKSLIRLDDKNSQEHTLSKLEKLIEEKSKEDEDLVSLSQGILTLRMIIIASTVQKDETEEGPPTKLDLVAPDPLKDQFNARLLCALMNIVGDERASQNDWFEAPAPEDIDEEACNETVTVNLLEIAEKFLPTFKFKEEVEKGFVNTTELKRSKRTKTALYKPGEQIDDTKRLRFDVSALTTHPSMRGLGRGANRGITKGFFQGFRGRGRGFGRGRGRGRGSDDAFRQRRQNTSRPPSMHVDDFVNMEHKGDTIMSQTQLKDQSASTPNSDRYSSSSYGSPNRWGGGNYGNQSSFRRSNDGNNQNQHGRNQSSGGGDSGGGYNRQYFGGGGNRFHNRSNSEWNNKGYSYRGSRDGYNSRPNRGGGYWGGPKQNDRYSCGGYRHRGRHQRTFTR